nr:unnamed protein product [Digitaria exilis]
MAESVLSMVAVPMVALVFSSSSSFWWREQQRHGGLSKRGSPVGKQEVSWCLQPPFVQQSGMPLPLPCPYLMSAHHNRYLLSQNQGWRRGQDAASHVQLGQDNIARRHVGQHADTAAAIRRSSCSAAVESRWPSSSNGRSSSTEQACWMMNKQQPQQQRSSRVAVPNLEISLGRQGWQHNLQDQQQQLRSGGQQRRKS